MGWEQEQQAKDHQARCGTQFSPHQAPSTPLLGPRGWTLGRGGTGGVSYLLLPGSPRCDGATAFAVAGASRRISQPAALGAKLMALVCLGAAVLFRPVPGASWVLAGTEITVQRTEAARKSRAETAGAAPTTGLRSRPGGTNQIGGGRSGAGLLIR